MKDEITTLTGLLLAEAITALDAELPPSAYSPVPGGADLTDIDPNHMRMVLNTIFGLCGYGWGYTYSPENIHTRTDIRTTSRGGERTVIIAVVKHLEFWYKLQNGSTTYICSIPTTGSSENSNDSYALKGALTNAIGNAASNIGFQQSVYLGQRSHKTVGRKAPKPAPKRATPKTPVPKPKPAAVGEIDDLDAPAPETVNGNGNYGSFVIPIGKHEGKTLAEVSRKAVEWYASTLAPTSDAARQLQTAARAYLEALQQPA
jgi:hypothetical protein